MTKPLLRDTIGLTAAVLLSAAITASMALADDDDDDDDARRGGVSSVIRVIDSTNADVGIFVALESGTGRPLAYVQTEGLDFLVKISESPLFGMRLTGLEDQGAVSTRDRVWYGLPQCQGQAYMRKMGLPGLPLAVRSPDPAMPSQRLTWAPLDPLETPQTVSTSSVLRVDFFACGANGVCCIDGAFNESVVEAQQLATDLDVLFLPPFRVVPPGMP